MSDQPRTNQAQRFTLEELRRDRSRVVTAAKENRGAIVVDDKGQRRFSLWIPQGPIDHDD